MRTGIGAPRLTFEYRSIRDYIWKYEHFGMQTGIAAPKVTCGSGASRFAYRYRGTRASIQV